MSRLLAFAVCWLLAFQVGAQKPPSLSWMTLSGAPPLIIANGGQSGLFPDQTLSAYNDALNKTVPGSAMLCDLQLSKDARGICRSKIDLSLSTNIQDVFNGNSSAYDVNGNTTTGYFSIDFTAAQLSSLTARQSNPSRPPVFDGEPLFTPEDLAQLLQSYTNVTGLSALLWINVEHAKFYEEHKINITAYLLSAVRNLSPDFISSTEVGLLTTLAARAGKSKARRIFKIPNVADMEPSTNRTYASYLANLTNIRAFASGILVPKSLIWPINEKTFLLEPPTSLVKDAHAAKLEVFAFDFANDAYPSSFNYSFNPINEQLRFMDGPGFSVDGVLTDFPTTASVAMECFAKQNSSKEASGRKTLEPFAGRQVLTHGGGDSGNFPGSTNLSYQSALDKHADYIDCPIQMTKDGVAICRQFPDLLMTTDVSSSPQLFSKRRLVSAVQTDEGVFTFDLTWDQINSLKATIYSPEKSSNTFRNTEYDGTQPVIRLADFLDICKANPKVGAYIVLQNAYILNGSLGIDTAAAVVSAVKKAGLDNRPDLVVQSEDAVILRELQKSLPSATLIYDTTQGGSFTLSDSVLKEIKQFASGVAVSRALVSPTSSSILLQPSDVVSAAHSHNLSVLVVYFRNEFVSLPFDFMADPVLQLNTYMKVYGIDGIVTDFPGTAKSYLGNTCLKPSSSQIVGIPTIMPGALYAFQGIAPPPKGAPAPELDIAEPPLPSSIAEVSPSPSPQPSSANREGATWIQSAMLAAAGLVAAFAF